MSKYGEGELGFEGGMRQRFLLEPTFEQGCTDMKREYRKKHLVKRLEHEIFANTPQEIRDFVSSHFGFIEDIVRRPGCLAFPTKERVRAFLLEHFWEHSPVREKNFSHAVFVEACENSGYINTRRHELHEHRARVASESRQGSLAVQGFVEEMARIQVLEQESARARDEIAAIEDAFLSFLTGLSPEARKLREFSQRTAIEEAVAPAAYTAMVQRCVEGILAVKRSDLTPKRIVAQLIQTLADLGLTLEGIYPSRLFDVSKGIAGSSARSLEKEHIKTLRARGFSDDDIMDAMQDVWRNGLTLDTAYPSFPKVHADILVYLEHYQNTFYEIAAFKRHLGDIEESVQGYRSTPSSDTKQEIAKSIMELLQADDITEQLFTLMQVFFTKK